MSFENRMRLRMREAKAMEGQPTLDRIMARFIIRSLIGDCDICLDQRKDWIELAESQFEQLTALKECVAHYRREATRAQREMQKAQAEAARHQRSAEILSGRVTQREDSLWEKRLDFEARIDEMRRDTTAKIDEMRRIIDLQRQIIETLESPSSPPAPPLAPP